MIGRLGVSLAFAVSALMVVALLFQDGRPQDVPEPGIARLACVSYANREAMISLSGPPAHIPREEIEADLRQLSAISDCVRTYHADRGQDQVVAVAAKLGMKVILGASIGTDRARNAAEIERAVRAARAYPGTVRMIVIGNEVLLRRDLSLEEMSKTVADVRSAAGVPVTTAEIWSSWLRDPALAQAVDVITVHILPYWDFQARTVEDVLADTEASVRKVAQAYPDKPIFIGEVGWPSSGRPRGGLMPGLVEQARFLRGLVALCQRNGWSYNAIEGFDQSWKRRWEGSAGGSWGVLDSHGQRKWPLNGPVSANPAWGGQASWAVLAGFALLIISLRWAVPFGQRGRLVAVGCVAPWLGWALVYQATFSAGIVARIYEPVLAAAAWVVSAVLAVAILAVITGRKPWRVPSIRDVVARPEGVSAVGWAQWAARLGASAAALALLLDPRYRDFLWPCFLIPAMAGLVAVHGIRGGAERALGVLLLAAGPVAAWREGLENTPAVLWAAACVVMALPLLWPLRSGLDEHGERQHR